MTYAVIVLLVSYLVYLIVTDILTVMITKENYVEGAHYVEYLCLY